MYEREALIGEGGFGRVYRGRHKESGEIVALKYQDLGSMSKQNNMQSRSLHQTYFYSEISRFNAGYRQGVEHLEDVESQEHYQVALGHSYQERIASYHGVC